MVTSRSVGDLGLTPSPNWGSSDELRFKNRYICRGTTIPSITTNKIATRIQSVVIDPSYDMVLFSKGITLIGSVTLTNNCSMIDQLNGSGREVWLNQVRNKRESMAIITKAKRGQ